jgi:acyl-CoA synthetase (NDP forming)
MLAPATVAVVGANEQLGMSNNAVLPMLESGRSVALVNPRRNTLYGQPVHRDLSVAVTALGTGIDAVLSLVNAERSVDVVEEAATLGCGGVAVTAAGFSEAGTVAGEELQRRLLDVASRTGIAVVGPNCAGFRNVPLNANLFTGGRLGLPVAGIDTAGGVGIVSQSGFLVRSACAAAKERQLGVSIAVSSGNEAVCDLADYVSVLADDPDTSVICLVIETVRRPDAFLGAVSQARQAGKPVIALKLGRSARARRIMQSHTGAIASDSWVYDLAFAEHGVIAARDVDDLLDRAQLFVQLPAERIRRVGRLAVITTSGGVATSATDIADDPGRAYDAELPPLTELEDWVRARVPGDTLNPLDLTGFVMTDRALTEEVFDRYAGAVDALVLGWWAGADDEGWSNTLLTPFANAAARSDTICLVSQLEATGIGAWVAEWRRRGLSFARGIESVYRAVDAVNGFVRENERVRSDAHVGAPEPGPARPPALIDTTAGRMVGFSDAMELMTSVGIAVAPWVVLEDDDFNVPAQLGERLAVKLADVAHRTELGAVRLGVTRSDLRSVAEELRRIAADHGVRDAIAVQAMLRGHGESFAGLKSGTDFGSVVLLGVGGVLVEVSNQVHGRFLPVDAADARSLADGVVSTVNGLRGQVPWDAEHLASIVVGLDRLWREHGGWIESVDINPLIVGEAGLVAVDALVIAQDHR